MSPYSLPKLQIIPYGINNNSEVLEVGHTNNLVPEVKFRKKHLTNSVSLPR
jgi:hypothetical protein